MKSNLAILSALVLSALALPAMDRWEALSQIESRNNDQAVGRDGEVSRYQILPGIWARAWSRHQPANIGMRPTDPTAAKIVANRIMQARCRAFESRYRRAPEDFEFYLLWHRPACYIGRAVPRPITAVEADRGRRFASLCQSCPEVPLRQSAPERIHFPAPGLEAMEPLNVLGVPFSASDDITAFALRNLK